MIISERPVNAVDKLFANNRISPKVNKIIHGYGYHIRRDGRYVMVDGVNGFASGSIEIAVKKVLSIIICEKKGFANRHVVTDRDIIEFFQL